MDQSSITGKVRCDVKIRLDKVRPSIRVDILAYPIVEETGTGTRPPTC